MAGVNAGVVSKREEHGPNRRDERGVIAAREIGPPDRAGKQRVPHEEILAGIRRQSNLQAHPARAVTGRVVRRRHTVAEADRLAWRIEVVDRRLRLDRQAEHLAHLDHPFVKEQIVAVEVDRHAERPLRGADAGDVVDVGMRQQNPANGEPLLAGDVEQRGHLVPWIDQHRFAGVGTRNHEPVLEERLDGAALDYDHAVILAIIDDLMFTSKVKAAAAHLGVPISFARSSAAALAEMRSAPPTLVILDLNNPRTDPLGTVGQMKADPLLTKIPIVGYASHVQTDVIEAARKAGVDDVLARSAFTQRLPEILARGL